MVTLPRLNQYSTDELAELCEISPAFALYSGLLKDPALDSLLKARHEAWLECTAATLGKTATAEIICRYWSDAADRILQIAWRESGLENLPAALFALGKHGAQELNLSSDIDVLLVAEPAVAMEVERALRKFRARIQQAGPAGFCFRLDFDLRPGGTMGPLITTPSQFQDYYWSQGETWERLALVRLRAITGPKTVTEPIEDLAVRFSFRKFLDFTLLEDLKTLRTQVHQFGFDRKEGEIHIKLEVGGIRDIELFVHSLQILNGGKIPALRTRSTTQAIERLEDHGLLKPTDAKVLKDRYWEFRQLENQAQAVADRQTHFLRSTDKADVPRKMVEVDNIVTTLLGGVTDQKAHLPSSSAAQLEWLSGLGFSDGSMHETWPQLIGATALSHKNDRDERARQEFLFAFVSDLAKQGRDRDLGLSRLVDFVRATRAKATFFTMLLRSPNLIQDLARLFCQSPYLGSILTARPELLDHFILQADEPWATEPDLLLQQMNDRKLLTEIWSANQFLADRQIDALFGRVTATADDICRELLRFLKSEFPGSTVEILTMGKWGGRELGIRSDLDFVFLCDGAPTDQDYKVARRFISRLSDPQKGGHLFEVDLRLRPSGQSGALLVSRASLEEYWRERAEPWERQAYLRARPLDAEIKIQQSDLFARSLSSDDLVELARIRKALLIPTTGDRIDIKYVPGGLLDIEFAAQTAILKAKIETGAGTEDMIQNLNWEDGQRLTDIYRELREFEVAIQLASANKLKAIEKNRESFTKAAALLGMPADDAWDQLNQAIRESRSILNAVDPAGLVF